MNRLERSYVIDHLRQERGVVPRAVILERLEISLATFKRDLGYMRHRFSAPVVWDREQRGYRYDHVPRAGRKFELPGLWFTERKASPQRLVRYRDNWYLEAWCHLRKGLRSFAVDAIGQATMLDQPARDVPDRTLEAWAGAGYGIFAGENVAWARLRLNG